MKLSPGLVRAAWEKPTKPGTPAFLWFHPIGTDSDDGESVTTRPVLSINFMVLHGQSFDVTADGQRFLMKDKEPPSIKITQIVFV
jgi:hypothetical protein